MSQSVDLAAYQRDFIAREGNLRFRLAMTEVRNAARREGSDHSADEKRAAAAAAVEHLARSIEGS